MKTPSCIQTNVLAKLVRLESIFFLRLVYKMVYIVNFGGKSLKGYLVKIFDKKVVRGNAVQIVPNFPAKRLSIYRRNFFFTPL